jgi:hypothetical protein
VCVVVAVNAEKERRESVASWFQVSYKWKNEVGECFSSLYNPLNEQFPKCPSTHY